MYSRLDPLKLEYELGLDDYVATLAARHAGLEKRIEDEALRPAPDCLSLTGLKRRKLRIKDEIVRLKESRPHASSQSHA